MRNCSKGIVLPVILIIMLILSVLGMALIGRMSFDNKTEKSAEDKMQAHYLARSGILITKNYLDNNKTSLESYPTFYLCGTLDPTVSTDKGINICGTFSRVSVEPSSIDTTNYIVVKCEQNTKNKYTLTATGYYKNQKDEITSTVTFSGDLASYVANSQQVPLPDPEASTTDTTYSALDKGFIDKKGKIPNNPQYLDTDNYMGAVVFPDKVTVDAQNPKSELTASTMFFGYTTTDFNNPCLLIQTGNGQLILHSDFIDFYGVVVIRDTNKDVLELDTQNSALTGDKIKNMIGSDDRIEDTVNYGLVYFASGVTYGGKELTTYKTGDVNKNPIELKGYFFFPNGELVVNEPTDLIPINGEIVDLTLLNILDFQGTGAGLTSDITYDD